MIDIHSHVIFNVDDGSNSLELSLKLLKEASDEGITDVVCTPHYIYDSKYNKYTKELNEPFLKLRQELINRQIKVNLHIGNEIYIPDLKNEEISNHVFHTLGRSNYVLVEFSFNSYKDVYDEILYNLKCEGYRIIIAHPERYQYVQDDIRFVNRWLKEGYYLQCNQNSLFKNETKKIVFTLIEKGLLHFIASDAHSENRPVTLIDAYNLVSKRYGKDISKQIFYENQKLVLTNNHLPEMEEVKKRFLF